MKEEDIEFAFISYIDKYVKSESAKLIKCH